MTMRPGGRVRAIKMTSIKFEDVCGGKHDTRDAAERATFIEEAARAALLREYEDVDLILGEIFDHRQAIMILLQAPDLPVEDLTGGTDHGCREG